MSEAYIPLSKYFEIQSGFAFPSNSFVDSGVPIVRMSDLKSGNLRFENTKYVGINWLKTSAAFSLKEGDFLIGMSGSLSNHATVTVDDLPALLNQRVGRLKQKSPGADYDYACYWLKSEDYARYAEIQGEGAAQKNISSKQITNFHYKNVSLCTQRKIVSILKTIDRTIEKTEAIIEKYQQIKAGLMHDLFTRGVTTDGKLRATREQVPELYQETPIGWIPKDWKLRKCKDICTRICVGIVIQPSKYYVEDGIPALRSANVRESGLTSQNLVYISEESNLILSKSQVRKGDILSVRTGYPGTSAVVTEEFDKVNCVDILISTPGTEVDSNFLCNWVNSAFGKEQVLRLQGGMAQQHFNVGEMRELLVALPSLNEQELISNRLNTCSTKIKIETEFLTKLKKKKAGLMHDLLSGTVKVEEPEAAHV